MTLFQIVLKLIQYFNLMPTKDRQQLAVDVEKYEETATPDNPDKIKAMYGKIHNGENGIYVRTALPFIFFFVVKYIKDMMNGEDSDGWLDEE